MKVNNMDIETLTLKQIRELQNILGIGVNTLGCNKPVHPMLGKRCLIRTYSAGVHIGDVVYINPDNSMEVKLENSLRIWKWEGGGLSLSVVASNGIVGGRLNITGDIYLNNVIEFIPTTAIAEKTYVKFIEDKK
jgi:hypothetical protein